MEITDSHPSVTEAMTHRREVGLREAQPGEASEDPYHRYLDRLDSPLSKRVMGECLDHITRMVMVRPGVTIDALPRYSGTGRAWWLLRHDDTAEIRTRLADRTGAYGAPKGNGYSPAYINKHLSALRGILRQCWNLQLMSTDDYARAIDFKGVKGSRLEAGRDIEPYEMAALLAECAKAKHEVTRLRDTAIFVVLQSTGMRREELAGVLVEYYNRRERMIKITGKGRKERKVWISKTAAPVLARWLAKLGKTGPMFPAINKYGTILDHALSPSGVGDIVERYRVRAKLEPLSAHDFRRTTIGECFDAKGDSQQVRKLAGHANSATTDKYDRRGDRGLRDLIDRLPIVVSAEVGGDAR